MSDQSSKDIDLPWYQKLIALGAVCLIIALLWWAYIAIFGKPTEQEATDRAIQACGSSRFSYEISCPDPDDEYGPSKDTPTPGY